ncbi:3-hydroxy-D-aspartate aldolase [Symmachiella dynata]|uniref:3-hydroxy-D-aspartate aldolase n=1 Tax=Symmachiella dynata TaxID=2527995 RepID=A0A517ZWH7_9PLAN|nr:DSD1 family PLP-dependent enzyme [Symmachiella dynata]QDU46796.1 3-hydroxy-D-aspartate aldolase [Symmachiella dynata]
MPNLTSADLPNADLIGQAGSRELLETPILLLDLDVFERNLQKLADFAAGRSHALRPHTKTHKSVEIARRQIAAGAVGVCCTTLGEAEVMVGAGIGNVLITSPLVAPRKIQRLLAINAQADDLLVVADQPQNVRDLAAAAQSAGQVLKVLVAIDLGIHRMGVASPASAIELARLIRETDGVEYHGVHAYAGQLQHIIEYDERRAAALATNAELRVVCDALDAADLTPRIVTGSGTGTFEFDASLDVFNELQCGSYLFMDSDYNAVAASPEERLQFETSLFVLATIVSANHPGLATVDAGYKCFFPRGPKPAIAAGAPLDTEYEFRGDEHGHLLYADAAYRATVGDQVLCVTSHCDPTVNLFDHYHCVRGDTLVEIWPVDARGRCV